MRHAALLALLILLSGCMTVPLSDEARKKINVVRINSNVQKSPDMYYMGPGTSILLAGGAVGGAMAGAILAEPKKAIQYYAQQNGISIEKIVFEEISAAFRKSGKVKVEEVKAPLPEPGKAKLADAAGAGDATVNIFVTAWGFSVPNGFSSYLVPIVSVMCVIVDDEGKIVWRATDVVLPLRNPVAPMSLAAIRDNPRHIEDAWRGASRQIARNIVRKF